MMRLFIGIYPSKKILEEIKNLQSKTRKRFSGRFVELQNVHLTLQFIGWVSKEEKEKIVKNVESVVKDFEPFVLIYKPVGFFPNVIKPRVFWINAQDDNSILDKLYRKLYKVNKKYLKQRKDWTFTPHLTLARIKEIDKATSTDIMEKYKEVEFGKDVVDSISLIKSDLRSTGPIYSIIHTFKLAKHDVPSV